METQYLELADGKIAYTALGTGPVVLLVPGMGELKESYRDFQQHLSQEGFTAIAMDLRGHGQSDATFPEYGSVPTAHDITALIAYIQQPAIVVGSSMSAGSAVIAAAEHPQLVSGLVLAGPFVRNPKGKASGFIMKVILASPIGRSAWKAYHRGLFKANTPQWLPKHLDNIKESLRRPAYWKAFRLTAHTSHATAESNLSHITVPALVVMGTKDPDWANPQGEAQWIADQLNCPVTLASGAGHYPLIEAESELIDSVIGTIKSWGKNA